MLSSAPFLVIDLSLHPFLDLCQLFISCRVKFFLVLLYLPQVFLDLLNFLREELHFLLTEKFVAVELIGKMVELLIEGVAAVLFLSVDLMLNFLPALVEQFDFGGGTANVACVHFSI